MILSASRRTDIPCYYSEWFMNRIRAGYVLTRNPMNHAQLSRIPLSPDVVDCIVFWTKDAANLLPHLGELDRRGYRYYFQFTITPYGSDIERNIRAKSDIENTFITLSKRIGRERVVWRYDPILVNDTLTVDDHKTEFRRLCEKLSPYTDTVVISFVDPYSKLKNTGANLIRPLVAGEIAEVSAFIGATAKKHGLRAVACCEKDGLTQYGIGCSSCIDRTRIENILSEDSATRVSLPAWKPDKNQREGCGCAESIDIGAYNTCPNGCIYCYANDSLVTAVRRYQSHDPQGELLIGSVSVGEKITERKVKSNRQEQLRLF